RGKQWTWWAQQHRRPQPPTRATTSCRRDPRIARNAVLRSLWARSRASCPRYA
ncbi:unnamed protein product, partial [Ectocarpus sp. 13 AM-2016]